MSIKTALNSKQNRAEKGKKSFFKGIGTRKKTYRLIQIPSEQNKDHLQLMHKMQFQRPLNDHLFLADRFY